MFTRTISNCRATGSSTNAPLAPKPALLTSTSIAGLPAEFAAIDVLVNNAGLAAGLDPAAKADLDDWEVMIDTNIKGLVTCTRAILPGMVERKRGHVINLGSVAGQYPYPGGSVYGGTKAFVDQFSLNLRADLIGTNVRVTSIEPGLCGGTEFSEIRFGGDRDRAAAGYQGTTPLTAEDIAEAISWVYPDTGRSVKVWGMVLDRLDQGRIKDTRIIMDIFGLMMQHEAFAPTA